MARKTYGERMFQWESDEDSRREESLREKLLIAVSRKDYPRISELLDDARLECLNIVDAEVVSTAKKIGDTKIIELLSQA